MCRERLMNDDEQSYGDSYEVDELEWPRKRIRCLARESCSDGAADRRPGYYEVMSRNEYSHEIGYVFDGS